MIAVSEKSPPGVLLNNISWKTYESLLRDMGEIHLRLTYDDGDLEIMTLSFGHENAGAWIGRLIFFLALETKLPLCSGGSTTLKTFLRKKGLGVFGNLLERSINRLNESQCRARASAGIPGSRFAKLLSR